eukprot:scaffold952_cov409-Prasinococcus_capsulatus_cf.AAC.47
MVGQTSPTQRDCTPCTQLPPQSYSGIPKRLTFPFGDSRAVSSGGFSLRSRRPMRSHTRCGTGRLVLQKGKESRPGEHARCSGGAVEPSSQRPPRSGATRRTPSRIRIASR